MKKRNTIIIILCIVFVAAIIVGGFVIRNKNKNEVTTLPATISQLASTQQASTDTEVSDTDVKVIKKYTFLENDEYKMVFVLENTSKEDLAAAVVGKIFDGANSVIGTERESVFMDSGAKSVVCFDFDTEGTKVQDDDYKITVAKATSIRPGIANIETKKEVKGNKVTVSSTNTGNFDLEGVKEYVLFFQDDELVDVESEEVGNEASEVFEKDTTRTQEFDTEEEFDRVEVYYSQNQE